MNQNTIKHRLAFNQIDERTGADLRRSKELILRHLPALLDQFYDHLAGFEQSSRLFTSRDHIAHAKAMQIRHWSVILDGTFDETYEASVIRIGEVHARIGLE